MGESVYTRGREHVDRAIGSNRGIDKTLGEIRLDGSVPPAANIEYHDGILQHGEDAPSTAGDSDKPAQKPASQGSDVRTVRIEHDHFASTAVGDEQERFGPGPQRNGLRKRTVPCVQVAYDAGKAPVSIPLQTDPSIRIDGVRLIRPKRRHGNRRPGSGDARIIVSPPVGHLAGALS